VETGPERAAILLALVLCQLSWVVQGQRAAQVKTVFARAKYLPPVLSYFRCCLAADRAAAVILSEQRETVQLVHGDAVVGVAGERLALAHLATGATAAVL